MCACVDTIIVQCALDPASKKRESSLWGRLRFLCVWGNLQVCLVCMLLFFLVLRLCLQQQQQQQHGVLQLLLHCSCRDLLVSVRVRTASIVIGGIYHTVFQGRPIESSRKGTAMTKQQQEIEQRALELILDAELPFSIVEQPSFHMVSVMVVLPPPFPMQKHWKRRFFQRLPNKHQNAPWRALLS